jgi:transcriptional regulator with XRE-family HTH domain
LLDIVRTRGNRRGCKPALTSSPLIRQLFEIIDRRNVSYEALSLRSGVNRVSLTRWKRGQTMPRWAELEYVAQALGLRIVLEEGGDDQQQ